MQLMIECHGGLGDQVCAEPTFRFINTHWPRYNLHIITNHPELFTHLNAKIYDHDVRGISGPCLKVNTHPKDDIFMEFPQVHTVDYISLRLLKMQLPAADRQIKIPVKPEHFESVKKYDISDAVIVHPGSSWQSKTFPASVWQSYINILLKNGHKVAVIGKNYRPNKDEVRGIVPPDLWGCINLIDKLSLLEMCAVLASSPILITNDSGPAHLSGAFSNEVGIISTVRRPDTLFHWRDGVFGKGYHSLEAYPVYDRFLPDVIGGGQVFNQHWLPAEEMGRALPSPESILTFVEKLKNEK